eukprot:scaffold12841_cov63-Phaeocystis_antarctica.AAC.3
MGPPQVPAATLSVDPSKQQNAAAAGLEVMPLRMPWSPRRAEKAGEEDEGALGGAEVQEVEVSLGAAAAAATAEAEATGEA